MRTFVLAFVGIALFLTSPVLGADCAPFNLDGIHLGMHKKHVTKQRPKGKVVYSWANNVRSYESKLDESFQQLNGHFKRLYGDPLLYSEKYSVWFDVACGTFLQLALNQEGDSAWARIAKDDDVPLIPGDSWETTTPPKVIKKPGRMFQSRRSGRDAGSITKMQRANLIVLGEVTVEGRVRHARVIYNDESVRWGFDGTARYHVSNRVYKPATRDGRPVAVPIAVRVVIRWRVPVDRK